MTTLIQKLQSFPSVPINIQVFLSVYLEDTEPFQILRLEENIKKELEKFYTNLPAFYRYFVMENKQMPVGLDTIFIPWLKTYIETGKI